MKICIPIQQKKEGGMYTFLGLFRSFLDRSGIEYVEKLDEPCDVLFVNSWVVSSSDVLRAKKKYPHLRVVQRVDGSAQDYGRYDDSDIKQAKVNLLTDLTVFQSNYCRYSTKFKFSIIKDDGPVIYNPVDLDKFCPLGKRMDFSSQIKVACASWSTNIKKGARDIYEIAKSNQGINFILCGCYPDAPRLPNIYMQGVLDREELSVALRSCDIFLHMAENDPCPNVILEALASGLPVLYKDSGGVPELVGDCGLAVTTDNFFNQLQSIAQRKKELSSKARQRAVENFSPLVIFPKYLEAISSCTRKPLPSLIDFIKFKLRNNCKK